VTNNILPEYIMSSGETYRRFERTCYLIFNTEVRGRTFIQITYTFYKNKWHHIPEDCFL